MSANSLPTTPATNTIHDWLAYAAKLLTRADITTARLDGEVLLSHLLRKPRTYLHAHPEHELSTKEVAAFFAMLTLRSQRVPAAYLTGHRQFYGRNFIVTPDTLIPRPESETIIDIVRTLPNISRVIDIGCGTGCLGISVKCELPQVSVTLSDVSVAALDVAARNATKLNADVTILRSDLLAGIQANTLFDMIIANLPYVDREWNTPAELQYEPETALYADSHGLALINILIEQAPSHLTAGGYLLLESDPEQHAAIIQVAQENGLKHIQTVDYITVLQKD